MEFLLKHLQAATDIPMSTLVLISVMISISMYFVRNHLVVPGLVAVLGPFCLVLATGAFYCLTLLEIFPLNKYDQWLICTISASTIGVIMGLGFAALLARGLESMQASKRRFHQA